MPPKKKKKYVCPSKWGRWITVCQTQEQWALPAQTGERNQPKRKWQCVGGSHMGLAVGHPGVWITPAPSLCLAEPSNLHSSVPQSIKDQEHASLPLRGEKESMRLPSSRQRWLLHCVDGVFFRYLCLTTEPVLDGNAYAGLMPCLALLESIPETGSFHLFICKVSEECVSVFSLSFSQNTKLLQNVPILLIVNIFLPTTNTGTRHLARITFTVSFNLHHFYNFRQA